MHMIFIAFIWHWKHFVGVQRRMWHEAQSLTNFAQQLGLIARRRWKLWHFIPFLLILKHFSDKLAINLLLPPTVLTACPLYGRQVHCLNNRPTVSSTSPLCHQQAHCVKNRSTASTAGTLYQQMACCTINRPTVSWTDPLCTQEAHCINNRPIVSTTCPLSRQQAHCVDTLQQAYRSIVSKIGPLCSVHMSTTGILRLVNRPILSTTCPLCQQ